MVGWGEWKKPETKPEWFHPAETWVMIKPFKNSTGFGCKQLSISPWPNWPEVPLPQVNTLPPIKQMLINKTQLHKSDVQKSICIANYMSKRGRWVLDKRATTWAPPQEKAEMGSPAEREGSNWGRCSSRSFCVASCPSVPAPQLHTCCCFCSTVVTCSSSPTLSFASNITASFDSILVPTNFRYGRISI